MTNEITTIPLIKVDSGITCDTPDLEEVTVTENDPAITVMTDFTKVIPVMIDAHTNLADALYKMKVHGIRLLLVKDEQDQITGVITAYDIQSEKPVQYGAENNMPVSEIQTAMIMTPLDQTPAFDFDFIKQALVRHVIRTMKELERPHTLVIESQGRQRIRGVFSTSRISKLLGRPVYHPLQAAHSLADMQQERGDH